MYSIVNITAKNPAFIAFNLPPASSLGCRLSNVSPPNSGSIEVRCGDHNQPGVNNIHIQPGSFIAIAPGETKEVFFGKMQGSDPKLPFAPDVVLTANMPSSSPQVLTCVYEFLF